METSTSVETRYKPYASRALIGQALISQLLFHSRFSTSINEGEERETVLDAVHLLGDLYHDQGKLGEAEQMYDRALRGKEALGGVRDQQYLPALNTLGNMGELYAKQDGIAKAHAI
ncbi:TPR-like protein [Pyrenophora tritici-repentis]|nr:TPR-like protein [Pyrenophora tritici-repentis]